MPKHNCYIKFSLRGDYPIIVESEFGTEIEIGSAARWDDLYFPNSLPTLQQLREYAVERSRADGIAYNVDFALGLMEEVTIIEVRYIGVDQRWFATVNTEHARVLYTLLSDEHRNAIFNESELEDYSKPPLRETLDELKRRTGEIDY